MFRVTRQPNATSIPLRAGGQYKDSSQSAYREPQCGRHGFPLWPRTPWVVQLRWWPRPPMRGPCDGALWTWSGP